MDEVEHFVFVLIIAFRDTVGFQRAGRRAAALVEGGHEALAASESFEHVALGRGAAADAQGCRCILRGDAAAVPHLCWPRACARQESSSRCKCNHGLEWLRFLCGTWTVVQPSQSDESEPMRKCNSASSGCVNLASHIASLPISLRAAARI